ncbi:MAG TPA: DUF4386 domain-containing protein [Caulobacteraceae bacterium]|nr:DUF4386 domain-containing protein [Caulobacteraceae bacterium]
MTETDKRARIAGAIYLLASLPAFFSLRYVPDAIVVKGDWAATLSRIGRSEDLFRLGIGAELLGAALWVLVVWALWRLFADVDRVQTWLMAALGLMTVPLLFMATVPELAVLTLLGDPRYAQGLQPGQEAALASLALRVHSETLTIAGVFWGAWLFPFGVLVWKSGFLPRLLGALLIVGGLGWIADSAAAIVAPAISPQVGPIANAATRVGELPIIFWLLFLGARPRLLPTMRPQTGSSVTEPR